MFAIDRVLVEILQVEPGLVPTVAASQSLGLCPELEDINFPYQRPVDLQVSDWKLPAALMPIDFGFPRILRSTFKHFYIRFIKEPMAAYSEK